MAIDYSTQYAIIPVKDEKGKIYGHIAHKAYLLKTFTEKGKETYEIVYTKKVDEIDINNFDELETQEPIINGEACINSVVVDELYLIYDVASKMAQKKSYDDCIKSAKEECYPLIGKVRDLYEYKKIVDTKTDFLVKTRSEVLSVIEKGVNTQRKMQL